MSGVQIWPINDLNASIIHGSIPVCRRFLCKLDESLLKLGQPSPCLRSTQVSVPYLGCESCKEHEAGRVLNGKLKDRIRQEN